MTPGDPEAYTSLQVPGIPGAYFRDLPLEFPGRTLSLLSASAVDVLASRVPVPEAFWCVAWPAGLALARCLASEDLSGVTVLELGCGTGAAGLGALLAGASLLLTDCEPMALRLALMNARRNGLSARAVAADWSRWPVRGRFDRIVGSDVTYEPDSFDALLEVMDRCLSPGGEVLITDPRRRLTAGFTRKARAAGWRCAAQPLPDAGTHQVVLYRLTR